MTDHPSTDAPTAAGDGGREELAHYNFEARKGHRPVCKDCGNTWPCPWAPAPAPPGGDDGAAAAERVQNGWCATRYAHAAHSETYSNGQFQSCPGIPGWAKNVGLPVEAETPPDEVARLTAYCALLASESERLRLTRDEARAARDAAQAKTARARAETEVLRTRQAIDQGADIAYRDKYRDALAESARLAAALGRVEALLDDPDDPYAHTDDCIAARLGHGDPDCGACWTTDLRTALAAAGTDETGGDRL